MGGKWGAWRLIGRGFRVQTDPAAAAGGRRQALALSAEEEEDEQSSSLHSEHTLEPSGCM